jgi:hypothetical protein
MNPIVVFVGPTVDEATVREILPEALVLPPAGQSDLISAVRRHRPRAIGLIDGYFREEMAVWHKEILYALEQGVRVFGSSSMGALRAAELEPFGMVGVGEVFRRLVSGELDRDDEVALAHGDAESGYRALSMPLINLRATLDDASRGGVIDRSAHERVISAASSIDYPDRWLPRILQVAVEEGLTVEDAMAVEDFVKHSFRDVKRDDAIELLEVLRDLPVDLAPLAIDYEVERSHVMQAMLERDIAVDHDGVRMTQADLAYHVALHKPDFLSLNFNTLNRVLVLQFAQLLGVAVEPSEIDDEARRHRLRHLMTDDAVFERWCRDNGITRDEHRALMEDVAICRRLHRWLITRRNYLGTAQPIVDSLRLEDLYTTWADHYSDQERMATGDLYDDATAHLGTGQVTDLVVEHLRTTACRMDTSYTRWWREAGFPNEQAFVVELVRSRRARQAGADLVARLSAVLAHADDAT